MTDLDLGAIDDKLWRMAALADLVRAYKPEHGGQIMLGDTVSLANDMIFAFACKAQKAVNKNLDALRPQAD